MAILGKPRGRPFPKGNNANPRGRPTGAKDKLPRGRKGIREMLANIVARSGSLIEAGIEKRMKKGEYRLIEMAAEYLDGKPVARVQIEEPEPITIILQMPDGTQRRLATADDFKALRNQAT